MNQTREKAMKVVFLLAACASIVAVALICFFMFGNGIPAIGKIGLTNFIFGEVWRPNNNLFGILPMIVGSIYVTAGAIIIGVPIGILCAVFMAYFCPDWLHKILKPAIEAKLDKFSKDAPEPLSSLISIWAFGVYLFGKKDFFGGNTREIIEIKTTSTAPATVIPKIIHLRFNRTANKSIKLISSSFFVSTSFIE